MFDDLIEFTIGYDSASDSLVFTSTVDGSKELISMSDDTSYPSLLQLEERDHSNLLLNT